MESKIILFAGSSHILVIENKFVFRKQALNVFHPPKHLMVDGGVMVDECITWKDHIDEVAKKAAKGIGILRRSKRFLDKDTLKTVYSAFVLPHFDYCSLVWRNCSKALQNKLQKLQNKAGRIITGDSYEIASDTVRTKLCWDTLEERREKQLENLMIQIMKGNSFAYLREFFYILF